MYASGTLPVSRLLFKNRLSTPAKIGVNSPVKELWLRSTIDPPLYNDDSEAGPAGGTPPDKLFRCNSIDESVGVLNSHDGMGPLNWFMLKSRYTNSGSDSKPLSGPHMELSDNDT